MKFLEQKKQTLKKKEQRAKTENVQRNYCSL